MALPRPRATAGPRAVRPAGAANFTPDATRFFGRADDLAAIHAILQGEGRVCTLTGAAGVGKTRAAREYALAHAEAYPGGLWFCDLSAALDAEQACAAVARALGMPAVVADAGGGVAEQIGEAIAARGRALLVLDNFEQLLPGAAGLVGQWARAAPAARFLVTSQEILRLPEEYGYELRPLGVPPAGAGGDVVGSDAVQLFLDRARHVRTGYEPTARECAVLGEIARGLDGIPLALELAAARMTVLGPEEILAMLARRFDLLARRAGAGAGKPGDARAAGSAGTASTAGSAGGRQATLRGAIDWSWNLLSEGERAALAQCSVFRGGFTLEAAERVIALPPGETLPVLDVVQALREKSLLTAERTPGASGRLRLGGFQSVLAYAAERLEESQGTAAARDRHACYFAEAAPAWAKQGPDGAALLGADRENLLCAVEHLLAAPAPRPASRETALRALLAYARPVYALGPLARYLDLLDRALAELPAPTSPAAPTETAGIDFALRAEALITAAEVRWFQGDLATAVSRAEQAVREARHAPAHRRGEPAGSALEGRALGTLGITLLSSGRLDESGAALTSALRCHERAGDARSEALALRSTAQHRLLSGRLDEAEEHFRRALESLRALGDRFEQARATMGLAWVAAARGALDAARARADEAVALVGDDAVFGTWVAHLLSEVEADRENYDAALAHCGRAIVATRAQGHRRAEASMRGYRGMVLLQKGRGSEARADLEWACTVSPEPRFRALFLAFLAGLDAAEGRLALAAVRVKEAEAALAGARDALGSAAGVQHALVELLSSRADGGSAAWRDAAAARVDAAVRLAAGGVVLYEVRASLRVLERAAGEGSLSPEARRLAHVVAPVVREALRVDREGRWFRWGEGAKVSCERRKVLRRLLVALVDARLRAPGEAVASEALIAAGWPGEKMLPAAARNRLKFSFALLRRLGLREAINTAPGGYLLDPHVSVEWG